MSVRNLLVPTDFSDASLISLQYALDMARDLQATVYVLNSYYIPINTLETDYVADQAIWLEQARQRALEEMQLLEDRQLKPSGVPYECMVQPGPTSSDLNDAIAEKDIDLVILHTHDSGGLDSFFGNMYTYAIRHAKAPVLLIPDGSRYRRPRKLVFATDLKPFDNPKPVENLLGIARWLQTDIVLLHVHESREGLSPKKEKELQQLQGYFQQQPSVVLQQADDKEEAILQLARQEQPDWLMAVSHHYGLLEGLFHSSLTKKLARETDIPLLVSHE
ncbi:universal stress protein [Cesiribacter andamanensis]|uniref:Universal stress protein family protein n=1 Tax=Cesiribacter andamanensis AMV16 TaxID=1279009 RepID=M7N2R3_9BACT|nr:universal stress protein [Cesiribacter andamanensis]EMR01587.1 Universal stress protein family protein [Cesiribacter andamanensis AMV16]